MSIETNVSEKSCFHNDESFWPVFPSLLECEKPQGTSYKGLQVFLIIAVYFLGAFLKDLRGCWKHKFLRKVKNSSEQRKLAFYHPYYRTWLMSRSIYKLFLALLWKLKEQLLGHKRLFKEQYFEEKGNLSSEKELIDQYFSCYRAWQNWGNTS